MNTGITIRLVRKSHFNGFTLIELLVVFAIIAILASLFQQKLDHVDLLPPNAGYGVVESVIVELDQK